MPFPQIKEYNSCNVRILEALLLSNTSHTYSIGKISSKRRFVFFEGFGPCLRISHPTHPHLGKISQNQTFFLTPSLRQHFNSTRTNITDLSQPQPSLVLNQSFLKLKFIVTISLLLVDDWRLK